MFGERLRLLRKDFGMTQKSLSEVLNLSPSTIGMYEQGRATPDLDLVCTLSRLFNVTSDYLLGLSPVPNFFAENDIDDIIFSINNFSEESKRDLRYFLKFLMIQDKYNNIVNK